MAQGDLLIASEQVSHYLLTVLRLKIGFSLIVFNGGNGEYQATIQHIGRKKIVTLEIGEHQANNNEPTLQIVLGLGICRADRMDFAIQKAVELGVGEIIPLHTDYSVIKLDAEQAQRKYRHWQLIAQHACEQSGRTCVPTVSLPLSLSAWLDEKKEACCLLFHPSATQSLRSIATTSQSFVLLSGSEGGFSDNEHSYAIKAGFSPVSLGPRILRAETAVVAELTAVQLRWGDF
jgi:16S rRNA (uracil1498-N3)-methyltransferase